MCENLLVVAWIPTDKAAEIAKVVKYAGEISDFNKRFDRLINRGLAKAEDDFTGMMKATRDRNIKGFNEIYEGLARRIEVEERNRPRELQ